MNKTITIAGVNVSNITLFSLLREIKLRLTPNGYHLVTILTANPEIIVQADGDKKLQKILNEADYVIPDGMGIIVAGKMKGTPFAERITGVQLSKKLLSYAEQEKLTVGIIGGTKETSNRYGQFLKLSYPTLSSWTMEGAWFSVTTYEKFSEEFKKWIRQNEKQLMDQLNKTAILFIEMGAPKQEYFINNLSNYLAKSYKLKADSSLLAVAVGGTFDELSGVVPQTPEWIDKLGMKWLFRLFTQPWRLKRQLRLATFISLAFRELSHGNKR